MVFAAVFKTYCSKQTKDLLEKMVWLGTENESAILQKMDFAKEY